MQKHKPTQLNQAIKNIITIGGLALASSTTWAEVHINPNEIWLDSGRVEGICTKDIDQDGDLDIFTIHDAVVNIIENIGTPASPQFSTPKAFLSNPSDLKLNRLGINDCDSGRSSIDIDADGDFDSFFASTHYKWGGFLSYKRNNNSDNHPSYSNHHLSSPLRANSIFGLPRDADEILFKDIDSDGDFDVWIDGDVFYENTGTPENAAFVKNDKSPIGALCENNSVGLIVDLNSDGQWDMLCRNRGKINYDEGSISYIEAASNGYLPEKNIADLTSYGGLERSQVVDIDDDGDLDIILSSRGKGVVLYTNEDSEIGAQFSRGQNYQLKEQLPTFYDLNSDGAVDYLFKKDEPVSIGVATNVGNTIAPRFEINETPLELERCNTSIINISNNAIPNNRFINDPWSISDIDVVDIDGDGDGDLLAKFRGGILYCENEGTVNSPSFSHAVIDPFGFNRGDMSIDLTNNGSFISFYDADADGDQDMQIGLNLYENIGNAKQASFSPVKQRAVSNVDTNSDGQVDSAFVRSSYLSQAIRLIKNTSEPITNFAVEIDRSSYFWFATSRESQVQLQSCKYKDGQDVICDQTVVLPSLAKELSLTRGGFFPGDFPGVALAMIDSEGNVAINVFDMKLRLVGSVNAGPAHSISIATGQFDDDRKDEFVVTFVKPDNTISAIVYNLDASIISQVTVGSGKNPSIAVGDFLGTGLNTYVVSYLSLDNQLKSAIFHGNGTLISESTLARKAIDAKVAKANLLGTDLDDYIVSLVKPDGTAGLIGFSSNSTFLGEIYGGASLQPRVSANRIGENDVLTVSLIQPDKKPAIIFLDNQGNYQATAVGKSKATMARSTVKYNYTGKYIALVYIDEMGKIQWEFFDMNGVKKKKINNDNIKTNRVSGRGSAIPLSSIFGITLGSGRKTISTVFIASPMRAIVWAYTC